MSEEEKVKLAATVFKRAMENGLLEVQVHRFPNALCTDNGRAINQAEPGWEKTLTGIPKEIYYLWHDHLREKGYKIEPIAKRWRFEALGGVLRLAGRHFR